MSQEGSSDRLPSFKGPRDLTLTSSRISASGPVAPPRAKRVFKPNIPPKRDGVGPSGGANSTSSQSATTSSNSSSRPAGPFQNTAPTLGPRGRGGRGRGRGKKEYIQSESVFAQGIGDPLAVIKKSSVPSMRGSRVGGRGGRGGRSGGGGGGGGGGPRTSAMTKATLEDLTKEQTPGNVNQRIVTEDLEEEKAPEEEKVDEKNDPNVPVFLPLTSYVPELYATKTSLPLKQLADLPTTVGGVTIKMERREHDEPLTNKPNSPNIEPTSFAHVLATASTEGSLFLLQLPDQLPVFEETSSESTTASASSSTSKAARNQHQAQSKPEKLSSDIKAFPEGYIGKFQILADGTTKFVIGENIFDLEPGKPVGFRQDVVTIDLEEQRMIGLGPVSNKFICTPDLAALIGEIL